jgi:nucleotide-binding universal stress UspA family protein
MGTHEPDGSRIVAGVDGSASSLAALEWAARQADLTGSALVVIGAWHFPSTYAAGIAENYDPAADMQRVLDNALPTIKHRHRRVQVSAQVIEAHPGPALVDASRDADLLVVGSRGHREFADILLGSVGMHCVTHAHCPVLVHRSDRDQPVTATPAIARQPTT